MARRSNAEIAEVDRLHGATREVAREIDRRVNGEGDDAFDGATISAASIWGMRAPFQKAAADTLVVRFETKDAAVAERVARAIRAALEVQ
jgi:hypothetical protein